MYYLVFSVSIYPYRFIAIRKFLVSIMFFCRAKEPKAPAHGSHQSSLPLFRNFPMGNILQSVRSLPLEAFGYFVGAAKLAQLVTLCASN